MTADDPVRVMLVAAEASGDALGAGLARALRGRLGQRLRLSGVGGERLAAEGVASPFDISELSIFGVLEALLAYRRVKRRIEDTVALAVQEQPDLAVLIDSWGFNVRLAKRLREVLPEPTLVKYVAPQVWASRPARAREAARVFDHLLSILAFEAAHFEREGLPVTFVGAPALARSYASANPEEFRRSIGAGPDDLLLLVAPGSRPSEIARVLPPFEDAVRRLKATRPGLHLVVPVASTVSAAVKERAARWPGPVHVVDGEAQKVSAMAAADLALACSGTVTTELAAAGAPMVVGYRTGRVTYEVLKRLIRTRFITLFNIAADEAVAPELIQQDCNGEALARELALRLDDPALRARQRDAQFAALDRLGRGGPDPGQAAADAVIRLLQEKGRL
ncbi:MAG TPA: lipid-A-disaccharide synthase [Caulobacteraceae bacterium]